MTSSYDPRPGRWILPLVVLAMVAFTYLFVRELPSAATATSFPGDGTSTTLPTQTTTTQTTSTVAIDQTTQAYLDQLAEFQTRLTDFHTQLAGANSGWDASPRTVSFDQAEEVFIQVAEGVSGLVGEVAALVPPPPLTDAHAAVVAAMQQAADAANSALAGLRAPSPDTGEARRAAITAFDQAVAAVADSIAAVA
ncbi:MAG: hypothetical protein ACT4OP_09845 [Actinomycetota bacterium]